MSHDKFGYDLGNSNDPHSTEISLALGRLAVEAGWRTYYEGGGVEEVVNAVLYAVTEPLRAEGYANALTREPARLEVKIPEDIRGLIEISNRTSRIEGAREIVAAVEATWPNLPQRVDIDQEGTCDGCAEQKHLVASYPEPDNEPWICADCEDENPYAAAREALIRIEENEE